jgi:glyoxylase-like metal-dependent hydrolase (beta-lactamase superfamily II)
MKMKNALAALTAAVCLLLGAFASAGQTASASRDPSVWTARLDEIRQVAAMIPGRRALRINVAKFAESLRSKRFSVQGAPDEPSIQARTVFQVVFPDGYVMVDSGMDQQVHKFFGRGTQEPYYPDIAWQIQQALRGSRFIVVTHEHGDHVAGVIRTPFLDQIAPKTILTRTQVQTLIAHPQMPEIKLTPAMAARYIVVDYEKYLPLAPGFVLIKAPGHTPGSQMIYVALESGREYLFVGDSAWLMDNVRLVKGKAAPWIKEDDAALLAQLKWLNELYKTQDNLFIVVSHDDEQRKQYIRQGVLGGSLELLH